MIIMGEQKVIELTKNMNTIDSIQKELVRLGVEKGDILLVHSSLSSLGWVCGGAQTVVTALLETVGEEGTLVMPAHSGGISDPVTWENPPVPMEWIEQIYKHMPAFDINLSPTRGMGQVAELFRALPGVVRSNHPQTSFAAKGEYAKHITKHHQLSPQFGMNSPLGKMYELNAKVLLLGVTYDSCTSFHLAEALNSQMPRKTSGAAIMENGNRIWKWFEDFHYDSDKDFEQIGKSFEKTGNVVLGRIGNAECKMFNIKAGVDFAQEWIRKGRFK